MRHFSYTRLNRCIRRYDRAMQNARLQRRLFGNPTYLRPIANTLCRMLFDIEIETERHGNRPDDLQRYAERLEQYVAWRDSIGIEQNSYDFLVS